MSTSPVRLAALIGCLLLAYSPGAADEGLQVGLMEQGGGPEQMFFIPVVPPVRLARDISRVSVANVEGYPIQYRESGQPRGKTVLYYFVQIELDHHGYEKLVALSDARNQYQGKSNLIYHLYVANQLKEAHFHLRPATETAVINVVLQEEDFLDVVRLVQKDWRAKNTAAVEEWEQGVLQ